jgi:hypothetical protein
MGNWIDFPDYNDEELVQISSLLARNYGYTYPEDVQNKFLEFMNLRKEFPYFSNARTVRNCMERARRIAATRVLNDAMEHGTLYSLAQIQEFNVQDFQLMIDEIRPLDRSALLP